MNKQEPLADKVLHYFYAALAGDMTRKGMEAEVRRILSQPQRDDTDLLRQALEALENSAVKHPQQIDGRNATIAALKGRLCT